MPDAQPGIAGIGISGGPATPSPSSTPTAASAEETEAMTGAVGNYQLVHIVVFVT